MNINVALWHLLTNINVPCFLLRNCPRRTWRSGNWRWWCAATKCNNEMKLILICVFLSLRMEGKTYLYMFDLSSLESPRTLNCLCVSVCILEEGSFFNLHNSGDVKLSLVLLSLLCAQFHRGWWHRTKYKHAHVPTYVGRMTHSRKNFKERFERRDEPRAEAHNNCLPLRLGLGGKHSSTSYATTSGEEEIYQN